MTEWCADKPALHVAHVHVVLPVFSSNVFACVGFAQIDIVVVSSGGYFAFAVERRPNVGGALFAALIAILLVILGTLQLPPLFPCINGTALEFWTDLHTYVCVCYV